jgi:hypothetical protein
MVTSYIYLTTILCFIFHENTWSIIKFEKRLHNANKLEETMLGVPIVDIVGKILSFHTLVIPFHLYSCDVWNPCVASIRRSFLVSKHIYGNITISYYIVFLMSMIFHVVTMVHMIQYMQD